jgi:hypothetical protein
MVVRKRVPARAAALRLLVVTALAAVGFGLWLGSGSVVAVSTPPPVPRAHCGPGSMPETSTQGRVPKADYDSGRAAKGYTCNTRQVAHQGASGGFKVLRYRDAHGNTCAFYDSTLLIGRDVAYDLTNGNGLGVVVLDMNDPAHPHKTANLITPTMLTPHESLLLNQRRGLLVAEMGTAATLPGVLAVYDVRTDCRHPKLLSQSLGGLTGHESGFTEDGRTFWISGTVDGLYAVDLTDPRHPQRIFEQHGVRYHGMRLSDDGRTLYAAYIGDPGPGGITGAGLRILDVSQVQERRTNPSVSVLATLRWNGASIPQVAEPFTRDGHRYLLEVDEFVDLFSFSGLTNVAEAPVGAARIINVDDPRHPWVVSDIRLKVHQPDQRTGPQRNDPGAAFPAQGYAAHYCSLPTRDDPKIAGCSMILSGLRLFDIRDVEHPKEIGYFNRPATRKSGLGGLTSVTLPDRLGGYAMSAPAWDRKRGQVWYSDANSGFYVVQLTNGIGSLLR